MTVRFSMAASMLLVCSAYVVAQQQDTGQLTPREMYYHRDEAAKAAPSPTSEASSTRTAKPRHHASRAQPTTAVADSGGAQSDQPAEPAQPKAAHTVSVATPSVAGPEKSGIRYSLMLMTANGARDASDDEVFHAGDCVQLKVESNKSGYLYVLHHGPDGNWQPLMPSPKMPDEDNRIKAFKTMQIPVKYCFQFDNKPGIETLFVAVADSADAMPDLRHAVAAMNRSGSGEAASGPTMMALNHQVDALRGRGMDIMQVQKVVEKPQDTAEGAGGAHAVYIVNTSDVKNDHVVAEVRLRHE